MTTAQMAHDARKHMQLIAQLRTAHGFSEIEARDYVRFCGRWARTE